MAAGQATLREYAGIRGHSCCGQGVAASGYLIADQAINIQRYDTEGRAPAWDDMRDIGRSAQPFPESYHAVKLSKSIVSSRTAGVPPRNRRYQSTNQTARFKFVSQQKLLGRGYNARFNHRKFTQICKTSNM